MVRYHRAKKDRSFQLKDILTLQKMWPILEDAEVLIQRSTYLIFKDTY